MVVKIGVIKCGNLGTSPVIDLVLDERADRPNIDVRGVGSGAKMNPEQIEEAVPKIKDFDPDFVVFISPNSWCSWLLPEQGNCYLNSTSRQSPLVTLLEWVKEKDENKA